MSDDTIQQDVSEQTGAESGQTEQGTKQNPREDALQAILAKRKEELVREGVNFSEEKEPEQDEFEPHEFEPAQEEEISPVRVKINGVESDVPAEEISGEKRAPTQAEIVAYQKAKAADEKLRIAAQKEKALEQREQALKEIEKQVVTKKEETQNEVDDDTLADQLTEAILTENKQAVKEILKKMRANTQTEKLTADEVRKITAEETRRERFQEKWTEAVNRFNQEYDFLANNQILAETVRREVNNRWNDAGYQDPWAIIKNVADDVAKAINVERVNEVDKRKKQLASVSPASARTSINRDAPEPKTRKQIVADMIAQRSMMR